MKIIIEGEPVAQGRPRFSSRNGFVRVHDPQKSSNYKKLVRSVAQRQVSEPIDKPISLLIDVYRSIPQSFSKKKHLEAVEGRLRPITKPDIDNYIKGILDGLNGVVWVDDNRIISLTVNKYYSEQPRVEVEIIKGSG